LAFALREEGLKRRALSVSLVLLLHALLLLALLHALTTPQKRTPQIAREIIFHLLPRAAAPKAETAAPPVEAAPRVPRPVVPIVPSAPSEPAPGIQGFGQSLFGCAPEDLANLSPEQRSHCSTGALGRTDDFAATAPKSHVKDPTRRAAEMAAKNTPGKIPCAYMTQAQTPIGNLAVPMLNLECQMTGKVPGQ
jgi:outer membrane biosynthesis protein TonB